MTSESTFNMEDFFQTVGEVKSLIEKISCQAEEVEKRHGVILSTPNQDKGKKDELALLNNETKKNANLVRAKLKTMQENLPVDENSEGVSVIQRIYKNQHSHLTRCFADVMRGHHNAQISFREKCKAQIQRHLEIVDKVTTDEELEDMLHSDNLFIFISDVNSNARISSQALSEIESRHQDIICLESSIKELHEIFSDTAMLLEIQGELINNIEKNVTSAGEYVDASKTETYEAVMYKKDRHKIGLLPNFFKSFRRKKAARTAKDQNTSD
ncbi:syntaxin-2-like [Trematomus bernacchii]|uniref:syntaxin-2-like n=1 Tax=Trematomus bernacchii TaxID=40690 RepID=UPI00146F4304|nr:syntaxin-2-like [Trematomus bernacchii]XP_033978746.1 syntaxin-2-like [Trematomus bernacchii]XP_033978747.1 syntaxin-2-like [Trematomus bernacchii]XP_033978748.1 syntaxin-2-like [Trematomus bernacchii]